MQSKNLLLQKKYIIIKYISNCKFDAKKDIVANLQLFGKSVMDFEKIDDEKFMKLAIAEAQKALKKDEVPVGCVIVQDGKVIGSGYNKKEKKHCAIFHAEIVALKNACKRIGDWRLCDATLFVTMEPCAMCAGAILNHRLKRVVIGVTEPKFGACGGGVDLLHCKSLGSNVCMQTGVLQDECLALLQSFFKNRRNKASKQLPKV